MRLTPTADYVRTSWSRAHTWVFSTDIHFTYVTKLLRKSGIVSGAFHRALLFRMRDVRH
jgi:hypothetical protein